MIKNAREGYLLITPLLAGCLVFYVIPFLVVLYKSAHKGIGFSEHFVGFENYIFLLKNGVFRLAFGNTVKFLLVSLPLIMVISYGTALLLKKQANKHSQLKSVLLLPYTMPVVGTVMVVDLIFAETGLLNQICNIFGLPVEDWLTSESAFGIAVLLYLWKNIGYSVILLLSGLNTISEEHYSAAMLDGASAFQQLRYITLPQMWFSTYFAAVFSLINAFKCFREIFLIGGTHPHTSIYMLQHFINNAFEKINYAKLSVASVLLLLVLVVVLVPSYRLVMKKEAYKE